MTDRAIRDLRPADEEAAVAIAVAAWEPICAQFAESLGEELFAAVHPGGRALL
jgi:hypothetical protein